jgi:NADH-quinone oxidoreductase subunit H
VIALLGIDPLLEGPLRWTPLAIIAIKVLVIFVIGLVGTMFMVWFERKIIAGMQNRVGPNKAGPFGLLQTLADGPVPGLRAGVPRLVGDPARR